jgi:hypothetical protein
MTHETWIISPAVYPWYQSDTAGKTKVEIAMPGSLSVIIKAKRS